MTENFRDLKVDKTFGMLRLSGGGGVMLTIEAA